MTNPPFEIKCPPELEDEVLLIESGGEMPEVSLADSLAHLGEVDQAGRECLASAAARRYWEMVRRDLDPANRGLSIFRGLERALANLGRMERFLSSWGWELGASQRAGLARCLAEYLAAESADLAGGRAYATCNAEDLRALAGRLGLERRAVDDVLAAMEGLPVLDFLGQSALARLQGAPGRLRRRPEPGQMCIELLTKDGLIAAGVALNLTGPAGPDAEAQARAELVWALACKGRGLSSAGEEPGS